MRGEKKYSILADHLGTPIEAYADDGNLVWERSLNANGKVLKETGIANFCPFLYQGQSLDNEIELAYNRFRYYDVEDGRYISQDPIGLLSVEYNFYTYVKNSNLFTDVFGLSTVYLRNNETYVGKAKVNAKGRYNNSKTATDIFTDIPNTDTAQGVEQAVYQEMLVMDDIGTITNKKNPVNMNDKKKKLRYDAGVEWLKKEFGDNYKEIIRQRVRNHYKK